MKLATVAYALIGLAALATGLEWHGHRRGYADGVQATQEAASKRVREANAAKAKAESERDSNSLKLTEIQGKLQAQREQLEAIRRMAKAALDERDALQHRVDVLTATRKAELTKTAHDDPQCADLARLPVCPAVAERLWGKAAVDQAAPDH